MEKETKHTPGEDEQNGPYIFTGGADRISSTVTFEKGHERSLILRKHLSEDRIDNQSIRYKVYDAMEDYKNYELTIPSTELSEMKKEREELKRTINGISLMDGMIGRRGCTYSDTEYDSLSVAYGYNECLEHVKEWIDRIKK